MENNKNRQKMMVIVRKRLLLFVFFAIVIMGAFFATTLLIFIEDKFYTSWLVLICGLIGGFVSIQQRLPSIKDDELELLSQTWTSVLLIPVYGAIFALVLYVIFLTGMIENELFPYFYYPEFKEKVEAADLIRFLSDCYPASGKDFAKLIFWSFVAGFSERFVPQIIQRVSLKRVQKP